MCTSVKVEASVREAWQYAEKNAPGLGETIDVLVAVPRILAQVESEANAKFGAVDALRTDLSSAMATYEAEVAAAEAKAAAALAHFEGEFPKALQAAKKARR